MTGQSPAEWYTYTIQATPVGSTEPQTKEFKFYLDNTKPTLEDVQLYEEDGNVYLTGVASDDFYIQRIRVIDSTQEYWYLAEAEAFDAITETGAKTRFTFDVTGWPQRSGCRWQEPRPHWTAAGRMWPITPI